jgi:hypothetical protein
LRILDDPGQMLILHGFSLVEELRKRLIGAPVTGKRLVAQPSLREACVSWQPKCHGEVDLPAPVGVAFRSRPCFRRAGSASRLRELSITVENNAITEPIREDGTGTCQVMLRLRLPDTS